MGTQDSYNVNNFYFKRDNYANGGKSGIGESFCCPVQLGFVSHEYVHNVLSS